MADVNWAAIAGVVGALVGVVIGAVTTWKSQELRLRHDDLTRFHKEKLMLYAEYSHCANKAFSAWAVGNRDNESIDSCLALFEQLRFVASQKVLAKVNAVQQALDPVIHAAGTAVRKEDVSARFNAAMHDLQQEGRRELGAV